MRVRADRGGFALALALQLLVGTAGVAAQQQDPENPFAADEDPSAVAAAEGLVGFQAIDRATVRIFAAQNVEVAQVNGRHFARTIAVPIAGHGSGVVVSADGLVVTAQHVIADAHHLAVRVPGEEAARAAKVVYSDADTDFALLAVDGSFEHFVRLPTEPPRLHVRQTVDAIGYPLDPSRRHPQSARGIVSGVLDDGHLQLGMSLNPGNSGGPLVDEQGRLVGIVIARGDPTRGVQGIGIAVPMQPILAALPAYSGAPFARTRAELSAQRQTLGGVAEVLTLLVEIGGAEVLRELVGVVEGHGDDQTLRQLRAHVTQSRDPHILLFVAALYWDAAEIAMERGGSYRVPEQMPAGAGRDRAIWFHRRSIELVQMAVDLRPELLEESPFAQHVHRTHRLAAPSSAPRPIGQTGSWDQSLRRPRRPLKKPFWRLEGALAAGASQPPGVGGAHLGVTLSWAVLANDEHARVRVGLLLGPSASVGLWESKPFVHVSPEVGVALRYRARGPGLFVEAAYAPGLVLAGGRATLAYAAYRARLGFTWWRTITGVGWLGLGRPDGYAYHALTIFTGRRF